MKNDESKAHLFHHSSLFPKPIKILEHEKVFNTHICRRSVSDGLVANCEGGFYHHYFVHRFLSLSLESTVD
jgi:hypothetical protein